MVLSEASQSEMLVAEDMSFDGIELFQYEVE